MNSLLEVKGLFDSISGTTLTTVKQMVIKQNKGNELFEYCLKFLVDSSIVTGINKKKIDKKLNLSLADREFKDIIELCNYVKDNNTGSDQNIINIQNYIKQQPEELQDFIIGLITKSIKLGANTKLINKAIPGLITEFGVMLAESYDKNKKKITGKDQFILTTKLDGNRIIAINRPNGVEFRTRQGKLIEGLVDLENDFKYLLNGVYDGELLATGDFVDSKEQFTETMKKGRIKGEKHGLKMVCYDYIENIDDFYNGEDKTKCIDRKNSLENIINNCEPKPKYVEYLQPLYIGKDIKMIDKITRELVSKGEEGAMLNLSESPYRCKRVKDLLKIKLFKTCDIRCVRIEKGEGKYSDVVGNLVCDYKGFELGVGSGLTDKLRKEFIEHPEEVVGRIVEIGYFEELETDGKLSVRFPTFKSVREIGKEVSYE